VAVDTSPHAKELVSFYEKRITRVMALILAGEAVSDKDAGTLFRVVAVASGAAVVMSEGERAYVVWAGLDEDKVSYFCSCGGSGGAEAVQLRSWMGSSSSCCHAQGLEASYEVLAATDGLADNAALLRRYPKLDNSSSPPARECIVEFSTKTSKNKGVFAVYFQYTWAAVIVRNKLSKQRRKNRVQRRAACANISCAKDHWTCPHAIAVGSWCSDLHEAITAANAVGAAVVNPFKDVLLPTVPTVRESSQTAAAQAGEWAAFSDETRGRSSRNLLPCSGEVRDCSLFDKLADAGRDAATPAFLSDVLCEAKCFACGGDYNGQGIKNTGAMLHTLRGRVAVSLRQWTCSCGELVPYDGAHDGLFSSSKETVFTRTFLDVMTQMVFTGHGTLSSAASVLCFLLESTKSLSGATSGLARQTLISAAHRFSRTLIVPAALFCCFKCKKAVDRPYLAVIADGQVISILRNQSQPLVRLTVDVVGVPMDTSHGSCLASAALRAAIRKRVTAEHQPIVRLTKDENAALARLSEELASPPAAHVTDRITSKSGNLAWAAAMIYFSFYTNEVSATDPGIPAAAAGADAAGTDGDGSEDDAPAAAAVGIDGGGQPAAAAAVGGAAGAAAARPRGSFYISKQVTGAVGHGLGATVERERWRVVRRFVLTFLAHPVVGAFAGLPRIRIKRLASKLVMGVPLTEWKPYVAAVESLGIVWPFLQLVGMVDVDDPLLTRAIGELLLFTCGVDAYWETVWRDQAPAAAKEFETVWKQTSAAKYNNWAATRAPPPPRSSPLLCGPHSRERGYAQLVEVMTGHVWPDLKAVRPFPTDSKAEAVNDARAVRVKAGREALEVMLAQALGEDDCRHAFLASQTFMPGVENFLCPCGILIGYDFLDRAESPAHVLGSLVQRFPLLPSVIYFDTACQMASNALRRMPWLINYCDTASSTDRAHRAKKQHGCSPKFDADAYPSRSVRHRTSCAESRHSINKAFKTHLVHLRQDHFIVQMRLLGAFVNLRVKMRRELGKETNHRLMCSFFFSYVQKYCDRRGCACIHGRRQAAEADAQPPAAAADADAPAAVPGVAPDSPPVAPPPHDPPPDVLPADAAVGGAAWVEDARAAAVIAGAAPTGAAPADPALILFRAVDNAVVGAVSPAVQAAVEEALPDAADFAAAAVADRLGAAAGQAAVRAAFLAADGAGRQAGGAVAYAAAVAAGETAAIAPVQAVVTGAVHDAVVLAVEDAGRAGAAAAALIAGDNAGASAGHAGARAAVRAAGLGQPAVDSAAAGRERQVGGRLVLGMDALQAALRGALRAVGVVVKQEVAEECVELHVAGGAGGGAGGDGDGEGVLGGNEFLDAPPGTVRDDSSSDESSYAVVSDSDTDGGGDSVV